MADKAKWQAWYRARCAALERVRIQELAGMTNEEGLRRMRNLVAVGEPWRERREWSGLVEQQRLFMKGLRKLRGDKT